VTEIDAQLAASLAGRFDLVRRLGEGGMGAVFLAEQIAVGNRPVALKVLSRRLLDDPKFLLRFQNEAASTGRIHHPNVVTIYESGQADDGTPYIAMEYLEGESLRQALTRRGALPVPEVAEILQQAARGLNAAHKLGIIHRDLKPDNIFLTYPDEDVVAPVSPPASRVSPPAQAVTPASPPAQVEGAVAPTSPPANFVVKIVDFGIAKLRESGPHTQTGTVLGTPAYMSFEQASGMRSDELDARSDVYSLGVVMYEMLTGRTPFQSDTPLGYVRKHMMEEPPLFRAVVPGIGVPPAVESAVMKALVKDRDQRYVSAIDFARELTSATQPSPGAQAPLPLHPALIVSPPAAEVSEPLASTKILRPLEQPPTDSKGATRVNPKDGLKYVWIPPGTFMMGCSPADNECADNEKPPHQVTITKGFWLGQTEVTVGAYKRFAEATGRQMPPEPLSFSWRPLNSLWRDEAMPIVKVTWDDAQAYCVWAGGRLPTEAEWEYAARAGSTAARYGDMDEIAWYADNSGRQRLDSGRIWKEDEATYPQRLGENGNGMHEVGQKRANVFGLYDILGNVWEWVNDWYDQNYYRKSPSQDPPGPAIGQLRILRGGSWFNFPGLVRVSYRFGVDPAYRNVSVGFRCGGEVFAPSTGSRQPFEKLSPEEKGHLYQQVRESQEAEQKLRQKLRQQEACREAARLNANNDQAHVGLGWALAEKGAWDGAIAEYRQALRLNPNNALAHVGLGVALEHKGQLQAALHEYQMACELDPKDQDFRHGYDTLRKQLNP
jgi:serine/threonine-protein kinase